ncbi:hypothetical protein PM082_018421 [Marasmius tenuissimus]|nr:hypothetical protein PM082_018421 [Marasmius tenuissimus]
MSEGIAALKKEMAAERAKNTARARALEVLAANGADIFLKTKALVTLFNNMVDGVLKANAGRNLFDDAHSEFFEKITVEQMKFDESVLKSLWNVLTIDVRHYSVKENREAFLNGLRALFQTCMHSGQLGRAGIAVVFTSDEEKFNENGERITETQIFNEWCDPDINIPQHELLEAGDALMNKFRARLAADIEQDGLERVTISTVFPTDENNNVRFPLVNEASPDADRLLLHDWYTALWGNGRQGPVNYTAMQRSPDTFYNTLCVPFGLKIADPRVNAREMSPADVQRLVVYFAEEYGATGQIFPFYPLDLPATNLYSWPAGQRRPAPSDKEGSDAEGEESNHNDGESECRQTSEPLSEGDSTMALEDSIGSERGRSPKGPDTHSDFVLKTEGKAQSSLKASLTVNLDLRQNTINEGDQRYDGNDTVNDHTHGDHCNDNNNNMDGDNEVNNEDKVDNQRDDNAPDEHNIPDQRTNEHDNYDPLDGHERATVGLLRVDAASYMPHAHDQIQSLGRAPGKAPDWE